LVFIKSFFYTLLFPLSSASEFMMIYLLGYPKPHS
jgi:hypothetical protein